MIPDWPQLADLKREWAQIGAALFAAKYPDPVLYVCGLIKASFAELEGRGTRVMIPLAGFEGYLKRSRLVADKVIPLSPSEGVRVTVGNHPECDVLVPDMAVSGMHCAIETSPVITVTDLGSANGTWVNEARIPPGDPLLLMELDVIYVGRYALRLFSSTTGLLKHPDPLQGLKRLEPGQRRPLPTDDKDS